MAATATELPECEPPVDLTVPISDVERAELVRRIFEEGPSAIERYVNERSSGDHSVARAMERFRAMLEEQGKRVRERADRESAERLERYRKGLGPEEKRLSEEEAAAEERQRRLRERLGEVLEEGLFADPVVRMVVDAPELPAATPDGGWARARRFFAAIGAALRRFWRWLMAKLGRRRIPDERKEKLRAGPRSALLINLPELDRAVGGLEAKFEGVLLTSPKLRSGFEARVSPESGRLARLKFSLARRLSPRSYARMAKEAFRRQLDRLLSRRKKEAEDEGKTLQQRIDELRKMRAGLEGGLRDKEKEIQSERQRLLQEMGRRCEREPEEMVRKRISEDLARSGLIALDPATGRIEITARLVDRFAEIALAAELRNLPSKYAFALGRTPVQQGTYERHRLLTVDELSRMDIVESLMNARLTHPGRKAMEEDDVLVNRELTGSSLHAVLVFDKSSSMEENNRIQAAKKAVLALFKAIKKRDRRNTVDLVGFDTEVRPMDLVQVWESKPGGFTNTGAALNTARQLLKGSRADLKLVYLITDGFPEAYTENGRSIAGDNERSLAHAVAEANELRKISNLRLVHILLEPKERIFVDAAEKIANAARGKLITTDPNRLAAEMLVDYSVATAIRLRKMGAGALTSAAPSASPSSR